MAGKSTPEETVDEVVGEFDQETGEVTDENGEVIATVDPETNEVSNTSGEVIGTLDGETGEVVTPGGEVVGQIEVVELEPEKEPAKPEPVKPVNDGKYKPFTWPKSPKPPVKKRSDKAAAVDGKYKPFTWGGKKP